MTACDPLRTLARRHQGEFFLIVHVLRLCLAIQMNPEEPEHQSENRVTVARKALFSILWGLLFLLVMYFFSLLKALFIDVGVELSEVVDCVRANCIDYHPVLLQFLVHWLMTSSLFLFGWVVAERKGEV